MIKFSNNAHFNLEMLLLDKKLLQGLTYIPLVHGG